MRRATRLAALVFGLFSLPGQALALGTDAGTMITNTATLSFDIDGAPQPLVRSASVVTRVDERLDVATVNADGGLVLVTSPSREATVSFDVTNTGNGDERFRLVVDTDIDEGGFDPVLEQIYIETNGVPGLQIGAGGDTPYAGGADDPNIATDATIVVHVTVTVPGSLGSNAQGAVRLSAVANTIIDEQGTDHPQDDGFPGPGVHFDGAGEDGVAAVVGLSHDAASGTLSDDALLQVDGPFVSLTKSAVHVEDLDGGARIVSGTLVRYELAVRVEGSGSVDGLVVSDTLPEHLAYMAGSLSLDGAALDDDFEPAGEDQAGYNPANSTISVGLGVLAAGEAERRVTFAATVR